MRLSLTEYSVLFTSTICCHFLSSQVQPHRNQAREFSDMCSPSTTSELDNSRRSLIMLPQSNISPNISSTHYLFDSRILNPIPLPKLEIQKKYMLQQLQRHLIYTLCCCTNGSCTSRNRNALNIGRIVATVEPHFIS